MTLGAARVLQVFVVIALVESSLMAAFDTIKSSCFLFHVSLVPRIFKPCT